MKKKKKKKIILIILFLLIITYFLLGFINVNRKNLAFFDKNFMVFAHRGGMGLFPENTIIAFENAEKLGVDVLEIDVHPTKDGKVVVIHDDSIDRTTNGKGRISEFTYEELEKFDAAYNFSLDNGKTFPYRGKGIKIPLLSDVLSQFQNMKISIEIKETDGKIEEKVIELIKNYKMEDKVIIASEEFEILKKIREINPEIATSMSEKEVRSFYTSFVTYILLNFYKPKADALSIPPEAEGRTLANKNFINSSHKKGLKIFVWTINEEEEMRELIKFGVDGIITDYPDKLIEILKEEDLR